MVILLAGFTFAAVAHRFDAAGGFLSRRVFTLGGGRWRRGLRCERRDRDLGGVGAAGVAGVLAAVAAFLDGASDFLLHRDGGLLDVGGAEAAEVVGGLEAGVPRVAIHVAQGLEVRRLDPQIHALSLVDPLLATRGGVDDPLGVDVESGEVFGLQVFGDAGDVFQLAVEVLEVVDHVLIPEAAGLEVFHEEGIQHDELTGEVRFNEEVLVGGLDAGGGVGDVRDRRGGGDR